MPAAYRRAPTLMAGSVPGSQGAVRVWSPQRRLLQWSISIWTAVSAWYFYQILVHFHGSRFDLLFGNIVWLMWGLGMLYISAGALQRPAYLTTDDAGIGISVENGPAIALRWHEIYRVKCPSSFSSALVIEQSTYGKPLSLALTGYSRAHRAELAALICKRAALTRSRFDSTLFLRPPQPRPVLTGPPRASYREGLPPACGGIEGGPRRCLLRSPASPCFRGD